MGERQGRRRQEESGYLICDFFAGISNMTIEMKKCVRAERCEEVVTSYVGFPVINGTSNCKVAVRNGASVGPTTPVLLVLLLGKLFH